MITLDANNPNHVSGKRAIEAELGQPDRKMLIFSGIAIPDFHINDDDHNYSEHVVLNLRRSVLAVEQATVSIGLASIGNDDTTFLIACDTASLDIDPSSQELLLTADLVLRGEGTGLMRFGYQIVTIVTTQATGISGAIRWEKSIFDASKLNSGQIAQLFNITANHVEHVNPPSGFAFDKFIPVASGVTNGFSKDGHDFVVPYEIPGAPYNQPLVVRLEVGNLFIAVGGGPVAGQTGGPNPVVLTVANPGVTGVDFRVNITVVR
jgi:hypothetical protein